MAADRDSELLGSVRNAARVLRAFSGADTELGVTDLSRRLGIGKSTAHRIVTTLAAERLLERGRERGTYRLGLALYELGTGVSEHVDLHQAALPVLTTLRHATGEMVHVAVLDGLEVVYVERLESHNMLPIFRCEAIQDSLNFGDLSPAKEIPVEIDLVAGIVPHFGRNGRPGERKPCDR